MNNYGGDNPYYGGAGVKSGNQTIRPVTVKQVLEATQVHHEADFSIDGVDVAQILLVGSVRNSSQSATNVSYEVGDGTGYIDCRVWLDSADDESGKTDGIQQDQYVCVFGTIKIFGGKRHVSANNIRRIEDPNEIQHHLLKALYVSLIHRGATRSAPDAVNNSTAGDYTASFQAIQDDQYAHLDPIQRKILQVIAQAGANSDDGVHVALVQKLVGDVNDMDLTEALDWLSENGHIYSTIDESHYAVTHA
ncbi:hypothetical protein L204_105830 [Cryptococcus depauperatus]